MVLILNYFFKYFQYLQTAYEGICVGEELLRQIHHSLRFPLFLSDLSWYDGDMIEDQTADGP